MNNGVKYGSKFRDPPSLQKQVHILSNSMERIVRNYKDDPEYQDYKNIIDQIKRFSAELNLSIEQMHRIDEIKRQEYIESLPKEKILTEEEKMSKRIEKYQSLVDKNNLEIAEEFTTWVIED